MKKNSLLWAIVLLFAVAMSASADDLWPPAGRGDAGRIFAEWDTWNHLPSPDTWSHGEGTVVGGTPSITTSPPSTILSTYEGRNNVLRFLASEDPAPSSYLMINLPNFDEPPSGLPSGLYAMGAWVQITYWSYGAHPEGGWLKVLAGPNADNMSEMSEEWDTDMGDGWVNGATPCYAENGHWATMAINIYGLPMDTEWEAIKVTVGRVNGALSNYVYIDQVVVDAGYFAVPEPGTVMLLVTAGLGALCYAWRRRRPADGG